MFRPLRSISFLLLLILLSLRLGVAHAARGGGRGGGDHDPEDNSGDGGEDDSGENDPSSGGDGPLRSAPCDWGARHTAFGLPGIYYNGTLTIRHHITANTAWDEEEEDVRDDDEFTNCQNDDRSAKTYEYPALLLVAPIGNDSDTNPFHWQLRAFQPANQVHGRNGDSFLDFEQRWVHIRSSDFVVNNGSTVADYLEVWPIRNKWRDADATQLGRDTRVYWSTEITEEEDGVYAVSAEYTREPPAIDENDYNLPVQDFGRHASQYVTLSNVCSWNQVTENSIGDMDALPRSEILTGDTDLATTAPTVWLSKGATAEMAGIGGNEVRVTLNNSLERVAPLSGGRKAGCGEPHQFEFGHFGRVYSADDESSAPRSWNITVGLVLSFQGSIVEENSTTIERVDGGKMLFGASYVLPGEDEEDESGSGGLRVARMSLVIGLLGGILLL